MKRTRDDANDSGRKRSIEFIGGPYDGDRRPLRMLSSKLPADILRFVCEDLFRPSTKKDRRARKTITSVALYELEITSEVQRYRFVGAISAKVFTHCMQGIDQQDLKQICWDKT